MPDLNELLRWSIANSTKPTETPSSASEDQQLQLRFNPASGSTSTSNSNNGAGARSALHSSDLAPADLSPASTPGPNTPTAENLPLPVPGAKRDDLTTEMLDLIMGKSDSIIMKEKMEFALNESNSVEDRVEALDDFEMLIELIDNANNMPILKLWEPLLSLLKSEHEEIVAHALWIIGTAVQNNLKAQAALYIHNALPLILSLIFPATHTSAVRAKATYALSSALKHWPLASAALSQPASSSETGYTILKKGISDSDVVIKRKMSFLLGTLIMQSGEVYEGEIPNEVRNYIEEQSKSSTTSSISLVDGLKQAGIYTALLEGANDGGDIEFEENSFRALLRALQKGTLANDEIEGLKAVWEKWGKDGREERGFEGDDAQEVLTALKL